MKNIVIINSYLLNKSNMNDFWLFKFVEITFIPYIYTENKILQVKAKETRLKSSVPHVVSDSVGFWAIYPSFSVSVFDTRRWHYPAILEYR